MSQQECSRSTGLPGSPRDRAMRRGRSGSAKGRRRPPRCTCPCGARRTCEQVSSGTPNGTPGAVPVYLYTCTCTPHARAAPCRVRHMQTCACACALHMHMHMSRTCGAHLHVVRGCAVPLPLCGEPCLPLCGKPCPYPRKWGTLCLSIWQGPDRDRTGTVPDRVDDGDRGADEDELHDDLACRQGFRRIGFGIALVNG